MISSLAETEALLVSAIVPCTVPYLPMYALSVGSIPYKLGSLRFVQYVLGGPGQTHCGQRKKQMAPFARTW